MPVLSFILGMCVCAIFLLSSWGVEALRSAEVHTHVDFHFQLEGIATPRQENKTANVYVRFRYRTDSSKCPFSETDK